MEHDTSMDIDTFISEIHSRPAIWDLHSDLYHDRNEKVKAWEEICELFINNFKDKSRKEKSDAAATLQRKWKSLRDSFNREIGKQKKSGSGRKEYIYFNQLSFLKRLQNVRPTTDEDIKENDSGLVQQQEQNEEETYSVSSSRRKATKRSIDKSENEILKQLSDNMKNKYLKPEHVDPDKDFLMSVLPDIRNIHDAFKIDFKGEMIQLIKKYKMYEPIDNYRSYSSRTYGYSLQNTNAYTTNQATTSTSMSSPSALSNYSNYSTDDSSIIEEMFGTES